ncbi:MAG: class I SAM-dependent rRNA methyltransferase [Clostridia bacterium]|nr:class I SAM-dependent rRNA methyltransferase [Clostridia bacterium]
MAFKAREYPYIKISKKAENSVLQGHPWVYDGELKEINGTPENGELVDVLGSSGQYLGTGLYNDNSKIKIRIISRNANDKFDTAFFERRIRYAWDYRKTVMGNDTNCCRIIFGEADTFPGLTVDKFNDILVTQTLSLGIEKRKDIIFPLLVKVLNEDGMNIRGIYERNDVSIRKLEGMTENKGFYNIEGLPVPESTSVVINENGIKYNVDFENGQKTGFFLDQKYNRLAAAKIAKGRRVLDCFTHTGSFALNAVAGGAEHVCAVDISEDAVKMAESNAKLNGLENRMSFKAANVFDLLPEIPKSDGYDFIILDPPAFTKSRSTVDSAMRGYKEINLRAMKLLPRGGYLATCSCSHFMRDELFRSMLKSAAFDAHVSLRQIEARQQSPDHPILWNVPETDYLKFYIFQIV